MSQAAIFDDQRISEWDKTPYPLVNIQKAIENGPVEIVDFPINMVIFHCFLYVHQ